MYIKSIILDGFKSYGKRTEIHGFDKEFNAITGLNGTGKSNILDSICFVLGITNLTQQDSGGDLKEKEAKLSDLNKEDSTMSGKVKALRDKLEAERKKHKHLKKSIEDDQKLLATKNAQLGATDSSFHVMADENEKLKQALEAAQNRVEAITAGVSTTADGQSVTLQEQLMASKQLVSTSTTKIQDCQAEMKHLTKLVKEKQSEKRTADNAYESDRELVRNLERDITKLTASLRGIDYEDGTLEELQNRRIALSGEIQNMRKLLDQKGSHRFDFQYRDPEQNFNRNRVKGRLCNLFTVKDKRFCLALGICAGGSLYNVVTDTDATSKMILQRGDLQTRTTMVPLNKISGKSVAPATVQMAEKVGGKENVHHALSLIEFHRDLEPVMRYVFGSTFICKDINVAKQVTYHRNIMTRCVTLDGDVVDPSGSLSGGARPKGGAVLLDVAEIKELKTAYNAKKAELQAIENQMGQLQKIAGEYNQLKQQLEMRQHELEVVNSRLANSTFQVQQSEIGEMKSKIESLEKELNEAKEVLQREKENIKLLEAQLADSKGYRERQLKQAKKDLADCQKKYNESSNHWKKKKEQNDVMNLEIEQLTAAVTTSTAQLATIEADLQQMEAEIEEFAGRNRDLTERIASLKDEVRTMKEHISSQNREIHTKTNQIEKLTKEIQTLQLEIKKKESDLGKVKNEGKTAEDQKASLEKKYPWILEDKEYFGAKGTKYDYSQEDPKTAEKKLYKMQELKDKMSRTINEKAMMLLEREEEEFKEVMKRKDMLGADRNKIMQTMNEIDEKKKAEVKKACMEVGQNFSQIFSTILPGAEAKLIPVAGDYLKGIETQKRTEKKLYKMQELKDKMSRTINEKAMMLLEREEEEFKEVMKRKDMLGADRNKIMQTMNEIDEKKKAEVKKACMEVGFNGVWKETLTELSGGQRSLVALSLVLAMLKYNPAPIYILDEVDAALDLSHTQNIGTMLKQHFKKSQFIIVSLKDGMFSNANVVFRTKFEDGMSGVIRTVNRK
uniref:Putative structural maintenance of chromosome protein 2 chromosome condensation complex condensin n=1 Tax=Lutzomyia longipalpis TaxID=7200 RepID=A0A1B0CNN4_LUTLO